jgi:outer membrane protein assembly factor BamB
VKGDGQRDSNLIERFNPARGLPFCANSLPGISSADSSGNLLALDPATGKTLWDFNTGGLLAASP